MDNKTRNDKSMAVDLLFKCLVGADFAGFKFGSEFTLFFDRHFKSLHNNREIPQSIELHILGSWWFGEKADWNKLVTDNGTGIEPSEPVQAYELAKLRWSDGATVSSIKVNNNIFSIKFVNNKILTISLEVDDEYAFSVYEEGSFEGDSCWSITIENNNYYYFIPQSAIVKR